MPNKVNWGLAASAWGKITVDANGNDVYGAPIMSPNIAPYMSFTSSSGFGFSLLHL